jgi:hypothetical protein
MFPAHLSLGRNYAEFPYSYLKPPVGQCADLTTHSNITEDLIWKFKSCQGKVLISPLPFDQAIQFACLRQGSLFLARTVKDHTKEVKKAVLHHQLVKTRKQPKSILCFFENSVGKKIFAEGEDIWPHSDAPKNRVFFARNTKIH